MLWNKQDPSVSEEAIRAIGWIVVRTPGGDKICPERALLSTAHLSFWNVKWAVTGRGPALVCGDTMLGYLNDERYVPQAVRVASQEVGAAPQSDGRKPSPILHIPRVHNVVQMLRELSGNTRNVPTGTRPDPITPAMRLVKDTALRNEETLASFKTWADRVSATFDLIKRVEKVMGVLLRCRSGLTMVEGTECIIHKYFDSVSTTYRVGINGDPVNYRFNTAREAAEIIERLTPAPKAQPVGGPSWVADKIDGIADQMSKMYDGFPENPDMPEFIDMLRTLSSEIRTLLTPLPSVAPPPQPGAPVLER